MSSSNGGRRSMDDVLSSIRRIIGAEKRDDGDEYEFDESKYDIPPVGDDPDEPLDLGPALGKAKPGQGGGDDDEPMSLTPGMRSGRLDDEVSLEPGERSGRAAARTAPGSQPATGRDAEEDMPMPLGRPAAVPDHGGGNAGVPAAFGEDDGGDAVVIDEAALEDMIRRIVRDEIAQAVSEDTMKRIVHEELNGELGQRISVNVRRMIQDEVARLLRDPG